MFNQLIVYCHLELDEVPLVDPQPFHRPPLPFCTSASPRPLRKAPRRHPVQEAVLHSVVVAWLPFEEVKNISAFMVLTTLMIFN